MPSNCCILASIARLIRPNMQNSHFWGHDQQPRKLIKQLGASQYPRVSQNLNERADRISRFGIDRGSTLRSGNLNR